MSSPYSDFASDEKANLLEIEDDLDAPKSSRQWRTPFIAALVLLLLLGLLSAVKLGTSLGNAISAKEDDGTERSNIPRVPAAGAQYLLGVGKADITGLDCTRFKLDFSD